MRKKDFKHQRNNLADAYLCVKLWNECHADSHE